MITGGTPTASNSATIITTAITLVASVLAPEAIKPPPKLVLPYSRNDRFAGLLGREISPEIFSRFLCRNRSANCLFDFSTLCWEAQVFYHHRRSQNSTNWIGDSLPG